MAGFRQKKISLGQTLPDKLRKARLEKEISLEEAQEATKIQAKYLEILEGGDYQSLPGEIYAKAWIKIYAKFLDLEIGELLNDYKLEKIVNDRVSKMDKPAQLKRPSRFNVLGPRILKVFGISIVVLFLLGYLGWEVKNIIAAPPITIYEPPNNFKTSESRVLIKGQTEVEVQLTINNEIVLPDENGNFSQEINLVNGLNNLEISAKKKHSKTKNLELIILREDLE